MKSIKEIQKVIQQDFAAMQGDKDAKWGYLLKKAKEHSGMPESLQDDKFIVKGCAAKMFLVPEFKDGLLIIHMDTDSGSANPLISRGLGALAVGIYSNHKPSEILESFKNSPNFFQDIGLTIGLTPTRANGFASLMKQISLYAQVYARLE